MGITRGGGSKSKASAKAEPPPSAPNSMTVAQLKMVRNIALGNFGVVISRYGNS